MVVASLGFAQLPAAAVAPVTLYAAPSTFGDGSCSSAANACLLTTAVANAQNGDTVLMAAGSYAENNLTIATSITLTGRPGSEPVVTGSDSTVHPIIALDASNITIANLSLGSSSSSAIDAVGTQNGISLNGLSVHDNQGVILEGTATIRDTTVDQIDGTGITQDGSGLTTVIDSQLQDDQSGIAADDSPVTVAGTTISGQSFDGVDDPNISSEMVTVTNSTISDNGDVGVNSNYMDLVSDTITGNGTDGVQAHVAGGIEAGADIIAGNSPDCTEEVAHDDGYNIDSDGTCGLSAGSSTSSSTTIASSLSTLARNGGPTQTIGLVTHSPAIGLVTGLGHPASGSAYSICGTDDQRGYPRHAPPCDAGAYQSGSRAPAITVTIAGSADAIAGHSATLTATLTGNWGPPTGTVTISADRKAISAACTAITVTTTKNVTTASCKTSSLGFGRHLIRAGYSGDLDYVAPVRPPVASYRVRYASASAVKAKKKVTAGPKIALTVKVSHKLGKPVPTGTVRFTDNGKKLGSAKLKKGAATLRHKLHHGKNKIVATYAGDGNYAPSSAKKTVTGR
jgi:hypothetical protein